MKEILVAGGNMLIRDIVKNTFADLKIPCQYLEASDGKTAYQLLEYNRISIIFLDWNIPEINGMEFIKKVRSMSNYNNIPIIIVTSEDARYNMVEALYSGATDYIIKPVDKTVLKEIVSEMVL